MIDIHKIPKPNILDAGKKRSLYIMHLLYSMEPQTYCLLNINKEDGERFRHAMLRAAKKLTARHSYSFDRNGDILQIKRIK